MVSESIKSNDLSITIKVWIIKVFKSDIIGVEFSKVTCFIFYLMPRKLWFAYNMLFSFSSWICWQMKSKFIRANWIEWISLTMNDWIKEIILVDWFHRAHHSYSKPVINQLNVFDFQVFEFRECNQTILLILIGSKMRNRLAFARF